MKVIVGLLANLKHTNPSGSLAIEILVPDNVVTNEAEVVRLPSAVERVKGHARCVLHYHKNSCQVDCHDCPDAQGSSITSNMLCCCTVCLDYRNEYLL